MQLNSSTSRVLVTGGSGFLGRAVVRNLATLGSNVLALHRGTHPDYAPNNVTWLKTDLGDYESCEQLFRKHRPTHLVALAWFMGPNSTSSVENYRWVQHSIEHVLSFAQHGGERVIFCGSCMEYDWRQEAPFVEYETPLNAHTDYGVAKASMSRAFAGLCKSLNVSGAWVRPFFLYGPGENPQRLTADVTLSLLNNREALCTHGRQRRDFLYVDDVAEAITKLLFSAADGEFNIGSGKAITLATLANEIGRQIGRPELIRLGARPVRAEEPDLVEADITRLRRFLDWSPKYDLETGIADTIAWWRDNAREHCQ